MCSHCLLINSSKKCYETLFMSVLALPVLNLCNNTVAHLRGDIQSQKAPQIHEIKSFSFILLLNFLISSTWITFLYSSHFFYTVYLPTPCLLQSAQYKILAYSCNLYYSKKTHKCHENQSEAS